MAYEARFVTPRRDFDGQAIHETPWIDVGSHRVYFLEISAIQLRADVADGESQLAWRGLPAWSPQIDAGFLPSEDNPVLGSNRYRKGYTAHYTFPSAGTIAFEADCVQNGMAVKQLAPLPEDQVEIDNDRARWPCFFPSSVGMITTWESEGVPNIMPCGSTLMVSRHPLTLAVCVAYARINERYARRASLDIIRRTRAFGCGVPYLHDAVVNAIAYAGNVSIVHDRDKVAHAGLEVHPAEHAPILPALPIHFECEVEREVPLGTHVMFLGRVRRVVVRSDATAANALEWYPYAAVRNAKV